MYSYKEYLEAIEGGERVFYAGDLAVGVTKRHFAASTNNLLVMVDPDVDRITLIDVAVNEDSEPCIVGISELNAPFGVYKQSDEQYMQAVKKWHALVYPLVDERYLYDGYSDKFESVDGSECTLKMLNVDIQEGLSLLSDYYCNTETDSQHDDKAHKKLHEKRDVSIHRYGDSSRFNQLTDKSTIVVYGPHEYRALAYGLQKKYGVTTVCCGSGIVDCAVVGKGKIRFGNLPFALTGASADVKIDNNSLLTLWMSKDEAEESQLLGLMNLQSFVSNAVGGLFRIYEDLSGNIAIISSDKIVKLIKGSLAV